MKKTMNRKKAGTSAFFTLFNKVKHWWRGWIDNVTIGCCLFFAMPSAITLCTAPHQRIPNAVRHRRSFADDGDQAVGLPQKQKMGGPGGWRISVVARSPSSNVGRSRKKRGSLCSSLLYAKVAILLPHFMQITHVTLGLDFRGRSPPSNVGRSWKWESTGVEQTGKKENRIQKRCFLCTL